jgi:hypothetical protein
MNREQFDNSLYVRPSGREAREAREKSNTRRFWFFCVPGGAMTAFIVALVSGSGGVFFWAWLVFTFLIYGLSIPEPK